MALVCVSTKKSPDFVFWDLQTLVFEKPDSEFGIIVILAYAFQLLEISELPIKGYSKTNLLLLMNIIS